MDILSLAPRVAIILALSISTGCDTIPEEVDQDGLSFRWGGMNWPPEWPPIGYHGGPIYNTNEINSFPVSMADTRGEIIEGVGLPSVQVMINGSLTEIDPESLNVDEGLVNATINGVAVDGTDFIGSEWTFVARGNLLTATLSDVETSDAAGLYSTVDDNHESRLLDPDRLVYTFTQLPDGMHNPLATCSEDSVGGARAVLYGDILVNHRSGDITARSNTIYIGCLSGAVGKAALHGYAPDSPTLQSVTLPEFETSIRALRADYCADGGSYTEEGALLTYKDHYGIHSHTDSDYSTEAVWKVNAGAVCVNRPRMAAGIGQFDGIDCGGGRIINACGTDSQAQALWNAGSYLWTKIPGSDAIHYEGSLPDLELPDVLPLP